MNFELPSIDTEESVRFPAIGDQPRDRPSVLGDDDLGAVVRDLVHQLEASGLELGSLDSS